MPLSSASSATAYGYGQLQRQIALRNAAQLEAKAQALASQAVQARKDADAAENRATALHVEAGGARTAADNAKQAVLTSQGAQKLLDKMSDQADKLYKAMQSDDDSNSLYGSNGRKSGSSYSTGSLFKLAG